MQTQECSRHVLAAGKYDRSGAAVAFMVSYIQNIHKMCCVPDVNYYEPSDVAFFQITLALVKSYLAKCFASEV